ncbi:MAG: family 10 glycosylhydrolase [bacterium]|nr:family 10 glycosylhydrolase [bacterium]
MKLEHPIPYLVIFLVLIAALPAASLAQGDEAGDEIISEEGPDFHIALWATTESIYTPEDAQKLIATSYTYGIDTIFLQVRRAGDAYYFSDTEARSRKLEDPDFDPLGYTLKLSDLFDIEIHAWLNVNYCWPGPEFPPDERHIANRHPEWVIVGRDSRRLTSYSRAEMVNLDCEGWYLDPAAPGFDAYFAEVAVEVVEKYDVDGIHLDFIRYPNVRFGYSKGDRAAFLATGRGQDPVIYGYEKIDEDIIRPATGVYGLAGRWKQYDRLEWIKWRSEQVNETVYRTAMAVNVADPDCVVSVAPWQSPEHAYRYVGQDYLRWTERGYIDVIMPMAYWGSAEKISGLSKRVTAVAGDDVLVYMGLGAFNHEPPYCTEVTDYLLDNNEGIDGVVLFDYLSCWEKPDTLPTLDEEMKKRSNGAAEGVY